MTISEPQVLIVEHGGQLTQPIGRVLRESAKVRSVILTPAQAEGWLKHNTPKAIILSGSGCSVTDENASIPPESIFKLRHAGRPIPILGICYGMQYLAHRFGGLVEHVQSEYGDAEVSLISAVLFRNTRLTQKVWMSHGDSVTRMPPGFIELGRSSGGALAAMVDPARNISAVQFHPEATQTEFGPEILKNFVTDAGCEQDWEPTSLAESMAQEVLNEVGNGKIAVPWSGGVDSTTLVWILSKVLGDRLMYFNIDGNQLREGEPEEIQRTAKLIGGNFQLVMAHRIFTEVMEISPDWNRRSSFQRCYGKVLVDMTTRFGATHIPQGTLAPDLIESGKTGGSQIVQHHNDLELPGFTMLHPMRHLFKPEVREMAKALGVPDYICNRQPFPGPGLYIRIIGGFPTLENIATVRWADAKATEIIQSHGIYSEISQLVVALDLTQTSGVKGDKRYSGASVLVRPFKTYDFMTGQGLFLPEEVVRELCREIPKHPKICRVLLDYTPKSPARTEYL